jgi:hypothetical protein
MNEKIKKYWWVIVIVLVIAGFFYWYEWRPTQIRKECAISILEKGDKFNHEQFLAKYGVQEAKDNLYKNCLKEHGLEK